LIISFLFINLSIRKTTFTQIYFLYAYMTVQWYGKFLMKIEIACQP